MSDKRITSNQRYNAERKAQAELMKRDLDRDKVLAQIYQESFDRMQREIDGFYMRYANRECLTKQEAMKRVSEMDVTKFNAKAAKAVKEKDFSHATNEWLKVYNLKMKVSRLELLKSELALEIQNLTAEVNEVFDRARTDEYLNEYKRQAGILGISSSGAKKRMQAILDADFYGQKFSARVWGGLGLRATLQREVFGSLNRIFTDMMGYKQEMKRLAKKYGTSEQNAKRLLKTEIARINADTQYSMLKDNGFTHLIYVAEPGACEVCQALDRKAIPIEDVEKGVNMYPMHPCCKCSAYGLILMEKKDGSNNIDEYETWNSNTLEKDKEKAYNQGMKNSGAIYGAWNAKNDPDEIHRKKHAELYYESVRNRSTVREVARIAKHTGFAERDVQAIYDHVFENYYELEGGSKRFDPDYDMAQSWDRLFSGKGIQKHDITLLHHELMESKLMAEGMNYDTAHKITQKKYDYLSELIKWQIERGDL
ncbi:minor capsid protein [Streptococcus suis]|uniref:Phage Mu protein F like protein n=1 Tax=Streptococcus suis TaxID=1307 RepID=A0A0Z8PX63_STRSU|nr:minor capsid protein [Streptococcus suis]CYW53389.1 Phage Mu protein F like protein [Streptococcus suis]